MKKKDLRDYMVVETRNGNRYLVVNNVERLIRLEGFLCIDDYKEDLMCRDLPDFDIVKVYEPLIIGIESMLKRPGNPSWMRKHEPQVGDIYKSSLGNKFVLIRVSTNSYTRLFRDGSGGEYNIKELEDYEFTGRNIKNEVQELLHEIEV